MASLGARYATINTAIWKIGEASHAWEFRYGAWYRLMSIISGEGEYRALILDPSGELLHCHFFDGWGGDLCLDIAFMAEGTCMATSVEIRGSKLVHGSDLLWAKPFESPKITAKRGDTVSVLLNFTA